MTDAGARRLVVVRHGETVDNATGVWQGHRDSELSPVGLAQAERAAPVLAAYEPQLVIASDLLRARVTAERIAGACRLPLEVDERLREIDVGQWQGHTSAEVLLRDPDLLAAMRRGRTGETVAELAKRVRAALDEVLDRLEPGRVAFGGMPRGRGASRRRRPRRARPDGRAGGHVGPRQRPLGGARGGVTGVQCSGAAPLAGGRLEPRRLSLVRALNRTEFRTPAARPGRFGWLQRAR